MNFEITSRHFTPSESLREIVQEKIKKINKYALDITSCRIILEKQNDIEKVEIIIYVNGKKLFASDSDLIFEKSITVAINKIIPQIKKYHDKRIGKVKTHEIQSNEEY